MHLFINNRMHAPKVQTKFHKLLFKTGQKLFLFPFLPFILFTVIFFTVVVAVAVAASFVRCIRALGRNRIICLKWLKNAI